MAISKDSATDYDPSREELEDLLERTAISSVKPDVQTGVEEASRELAKEGNIERGRNTELQIARPEIEPASPAFLELDDSWLDEWDLQIHRCSACNKPFRSAERLSIHKLTLCNGTNNYPVLARIRPTAPEVMIYPNGDLEIHVGPSENNITKIFRVSSQVLSSQSRVFSNSLEWASKFKTALQVRRAQILTPSEPAVMFLDDDTAAMELVLLVLHHKYQEVPLKPKFNVLVKVAGICEKYFLHTPLRPFGTKWCFEWKDQLCQPGYEDWIMLAWAFGLREEFKKVTTDLIPKINANLNVNDGGFFRVVELTPALPIFLTTRLLEERRRLVQPIRNRFNKIKNELHNSKPGSLFTEATLRCQGTTAQTCDWINLGFLTQRINQESLNEDSFWASNAVNIKANLSRARKQYDDSGWKCSNTKIIENPAKYAKLGDLNYMKPLTFKSPIKTCSWASELEAMMVNAVENVQGFELSEFSSRKDLWKGLY